jgi:hypothetical protein
MPSRRSKILLAGGAGVLVFAVALGTTGWLNSGHHETTAHAGVQNPADTEQQQGQTAHSTTKGGPAKTHPTRRVQLAVTGSGPVSIAYDTTGTGLVRRENSIALPWHDEYRWPADQPLQVIQLLVQSTKTATCTVTVDGKIAVTRTSTATKPVAICYAKFTPSR